MDTMTPFLLALGLESIINFMYVALGLGLVIFFHELGHFAVAKWCDVYVERFSIGFGPVIWSFKRGETEYALSAVPFGGYVKMLGQDDIDPSQLSSEEIAQDPRSYSAKSVPQRMAIISAGVIMNIITGLMFFAIAFNFGVDSPPSVLGAVNAESPAWIAGMRTGDRIEELNGKPISEWGDIKLGVALSSGDVTVKGVHNDGTPFDFSITPDESGTVRVLGVGQPQGLRLVTPQLESDKPTFAGMSADEAGFKPGDLIRQVEDVELTTFADMQDLLARRRAETLTFYVEREGEQDLVPLKVGANPFRTLGLRMDIGPVSAIVNDSPAAKSGLQVGDKITQIDGREVGKTINPLRVPDVLADLAGTEIEIEVLRQDDSGGRTRKTILITPEDRPGWIERPSNVDIPLSAPAIGIAFNVIPLVLEVADDSAARKEGIEVGQSIRKFELLPEPGTESNESDRKIEAEFSEETHNWAFAFWMMQKFPERRIRLTVGGSAGERVVEFEPESLQASTDWFLPTRGIALEILMAERKADNFWHATQMGVSHTENTIVQIYLTLRSLIRGDVSPKELHGPVGIATVAYQVAEQGLAKLMLFLGFLSINLAVLNFLPIPVLDGGHMVFLTWEAVTRKRPSERVLVAATYAGMMFVLSLMVFVLYLDIFVHWLGGE